MSRPESGWHMKRKKEKTRNTDSGYEIETIADEVGDGVDGDGDGGVKMFLNAKKVLCRVESHGVELS